MPYCPPSASHCSCVFCDCAGWDLDMLFFFSSRRRHTRWNCDWSSDVCSSDLDQVMHRGRPLTSEDLKKVVNVSLMENDCIAEHTIIACGEQGVDPHNQGSGPIHPNQGIIDRKSTRLNSSHSSISYAVFCLKKK